MVYMVSSVTRDLKEKRPKVQGHLHIVSFGVLPVFDYTIYAKSLKFLRPNKDGHVDFANCRSPVRISDRQISAYTISHVCIRT